MDIKAAFKAVDEIYKTLEPEYRKYITNKNIPILERWDFFINAPTIIKVKNYPITKIDNKYFKTMTEYFKMSDEVYIDDIINIAKLLGNLIKQGEINLQHFYNKSITVFDIEQAMEEVFRLNIESVIFDVR